MKEGWNIRKFEKCLVKVPKQKSIKSKNYLQFGSFPIISQESIIVSGYSNDETLLYKHNKPVVIFGDHTKNIKYIDFDFIVGADGVHILLTKDDILPKFFYYELCSINIRNLGYARHYKLLKEKNIMYPTSLSDQQRIVTYLDAEFTNIEALKANAEKQLQAAKDLFQAALKEMLTPKEGWVEKKLGELCHIVGGGTPSKRESKYYGGNIPWASIRDMNFDILSETELCITNEGLKNSTSHLINKGEIVIATRVGLGKVCILAQDTAINQDIKGIIPKEENIDRLFMFYFFKKNAKFIEENGVGATVKGVKIQFIENLSFPMIKISEQQRIADRLDALSANVKALQTNYTETITLCNDLKLALLKKVFEEDG